MKSIISCWKTTPGREGEKQSGEGCRLSVVEVACSEESWVPTGPSAEDRSPLLILGGVDLASGVALIEEVPSIRPSYRSDYRPVLVCRP